MATDIGWEYEERRKTKLQALAYETVRERTRLGSQHTILAIHQATEALRGIDALQEQGRPASKPSFTSPTVTYDARTMTVNPDDEVVSLTTVDGRIHCDLSLPADDDGYQYQYLDGNEWEFTESTLTIRDGEYFLHLGFRREKERETVENRTVLGVDLGIANLAVTSTAQFVSGRELCHHHCEFEKIRGGLQATGTQSAHRTYVQRSNVEARFTRDYLHRVSNQIVNEAITYDCTNIVFEDLRYIREELPGERDFHQWAHRKLVQYVTYKAEMNDISIAFVDPTNTSRRCSECGHTDESNRRNRDHFVCDKCGSEANADYNAAKNIGLRYVRRGQQSSRRTGDSRLALKSGAVRPSTGFSPYEPRDTDKSTLSEATP
ncbi:MAG: transposase [Halapricum sp.]